MRFSRLVPSAALLTAGLSLGGCGAPSAPQTDESVPPARASATAVADIAVLAGTLAVPAGPADITLSDVDAYQRALEFRTDELRRSHDELQQARATKNLDRELTLLLYMSSRELDRKTTAASGLEQERYLAVARILQQAAGRLAASEPADPNLGFRPEVAEALRQRLDRLLTHQREQAALLLQAPG